MGNNKIKLVVEVDEYCRDAIIRHINGTYGAQLPYYIISSAFEAIANGTPITEGDLIMFRTLMTEIANKGLPFEEVLLLIDNAKTPTEGDCISRRVVKGLISGKSIPIKFEEEKRGEWKYSSGVLLSDAYKAIDTAPPVPQVTVFTENADEQAVADMKAELQNVIEARPQGECRTCRHRDPEDKKCDCGALERHGCPFPVSDDYFCKFYEKGGAE